jgi:hypothetical protein
MRSIAELDSIPIHQWTEEESYWHCRSVFDHAAKMFPELMEPYVILLGELSEQNWQTEKSIMWRGLRETLKQRFPAELRKPCPIHMTR